MAKKTRGTMDKENGGRTDPVGNLEGWRVGCFSACQACRVKAISHLLSLHADVNITAPWDSHCFPLSLGDFENLQVARQTTPPRLHWPPPPMPITTIDETTPQQGSREVVELLAEQDTPEQEFQRSHIRSWPES